MLSVKLLNLVFKLSNVADDLKWTSSTHVTPFTLTFKFQGISMVLEDLVLFLFYPSTTFLPVHIRFYPSKSNDGCTGLCIKLCQ